MCVLQHIRCWWLYKGSDDGNLRVLSDLLWRGRSHAFNLHKPDLWRVEANFKGCQRHGNSKYPCSSRRSCERRYVWLTDVHYDFTRMCSHLQRYLGNRLREDVQTQWISCDSFERSTAIISALELRAFQVFVISYFVIMFLVTWV